LNTKNEWGGNRTLEAIKKGEKAFSENEVGREEGKRS